MERMTDTKKEKTYQEQIMDLLNGVEETLIIERDTYIHLPDGNVQRETALNVVTHIWDRLRMEREIGNELCLALTSNMGAVVEKMAEGLIKDDSSPALVDKFAGLAEKFCNLAELYAQIKDSQYHLRLAVKTLMETMTDGIEIIDTKVMHDDSITEFLTGAKELLQHILEEKY